MNECTRFEAMLEAEIAGAIRLSDADALRAHCEACESCRSLLALHDDLVRLGSGAEEPPEAAFEAATARALAQAAPGRAASRPPAARSARTAIWSAAALAAGLLLFAAGLFFGRTLSNGESGNGEHGVTRRLVRAMSAEAASNRELSDVEDSRFTYSNVSLQNAGEGRVALDFDVTTHVQLVEPLGSELAREVIVHALLDRSSTGGRLRALSYAGATVEPKVREAMVLSMRSDPNLAVRLKALDLLSDHLDQADVEAALLATLRDDESVQMRLRALDLLAAQRVDRERIRDVIREGEHPGDEALLVRLAKLPNRL